MARVLPLNSGNCRFTPYAGAYRFIDSSTERQSSEVRVLVAVADFN